MILSPLFLRRNQFRHFEHEIRITFESDRGEQIDSLSFETTRSFGKVETDLEYAVK